MTSSQLCVLSSSVDASMESASFAERLDDSFTSLTQPYRYTSYETLRPTTMLFSCSLPDELDRASIGRRAVDNAFKAILSSAAKMHPNNLYTAMCDAHHRQGLDRQGLDIRPVRYIFMWLGAIFAHTTVHSQHSNWNHYGTHLSWMVVQELLITWRKHRVIVS